MDDFWYFSQEKYKTNHKKSLHVVCAPKNWLITSKEYKKNKTVQIVWDCFVRRVRDPLRFWKKRDETKPKQSKDKPKQNQNKPKETETNQNEPKQTKTKPEQKRTKPNVQHKKKRNKRNETSGNAWTEGRTHATKQNGTKHSKNKNKNKNNTNKPKRTQQKFS